MKLGLLAGLGLLGVYFSIISLVSGWQFALTQWRQFWPYVVSLAVGFGIQIGLYSQIKSRIKQMSPAVVATTGTTSTTAMLACCSHYLANLLPILGTVGLITVISQYQVQLFWVGLAANGLGIGYLANKLGEVRKMTLSQLLQKILKPSGDTKVKDPVCGMTIDLKTTPYKTTYQGKVYGFCSEGCKTTFEAGRR